MAELTAYAVAAAELHAHLRSAPSHSARILRFDPRRRDAARFIGRLVDLDQRVFAPRNLGMPRWALYDCAAMPGVVCGYASPGEEPAPRSMCVGVPTLDADHWLIYALGCARNSGASEVALLRSTLSLAVALIGPRRVTGTVQWDSAAMDAYASFAPLELAAAWLPAHTLPATAVVEFAPAAETAAPTTRVDPRDHAALEALQTELEAGARIEITGPRTAPDALPLRERSRR